jgi:SAM-dependent methyltransferase
VQDSALTHPLGNIGRMSDHARRRRHALFTRLLSTLPRPVRILDVGGTMAYWDALGVPPGPGVQIDLLNVAVEPVRSPFTSVAGDARDLSMFADQSFDVVFSNSVIGHVGGLSDQLRMASEIRRVGRHYFVQTPNQGFPIDWRTMVPFFHFMPPGLQAWLFERTGVGTYRRARDRAEALHWATRVRNIRRGEVSQLFPGATIVSERVSGLTKSFIVHDFDARRPGPGTSHR